MAGTVPSEISEQSFTGNGVSTLFPIGFPILETSDLVVTLTLAAATTATLLVEGIDYDVTAAPSDGPTLNMAVAPPVGSTLHVERTVDIVQPVNLVTAGAFSPATHTQMHDRRTMVEQQLARRVGRLEAMADIVTLTPFDAQLVEFTVNVDALEVVDTFPIAVFLVLAPGQQLTGLLVAKVTSADDQQESIQVTKWQWASDVLEMQYITGLKPGVTYTLTLLALSMSVA